jgi:hypothetical protein|tara:strand:+ start:18122 stop:18259 length:138 start_codon:yes stop_codon:yes gene_type:complete
MIYPCLQLGQVDFLEIMIFYEYSSAQDYIYLSLERGESENGHTEM